MQRHSPDPDSGQKPDSYDEAHYRALFRDAPYYSTGRKWRDYAPAYRYGHVARDEHPQERFEQVGPAERKSVASGKGVSGRVGLGGGRFVKNKKQCKLLI